MHKTLADAITITKGLGIRYLWIDALCIVQGDDGDFQSEAGRMAAYYQNAELTLAATDSVDCEGGMLYSGDLRQTFNAGQFRHGDKTAYAFLESVQTDLESEINSAPLNQRGWVFQEGILSRRMVHFSRKQLIWECKTKIASEDGLVVLNKDKIKRPFAPSTASLIPRDLYEEWDAVVRGYSGRSLSKVKDKTPALAGATTLFAELLHDTPLLGLWKKDLRAGLLWRVSEPKERVDAAELKAIPSWSWMVVDGPVIFDTEHRRHLRDPKSVDMAMQVREASVKWKGVELTSEVVRTRLKVSGRLIPFNPSSTTIKDIWWDSPSQPGGKLFLFLIAQVKYRKAVQQTSERRRNATWVSETKDYFLVLSPTSKKGEYTRVGMGAIGNGRRPGGQFSGQTEKVILLV
ncbi:hypothetical protein ACHAPT_011727 [Fusarium lateritium]